MRKQFITGFLILTWFTSLATNTVNAQSNLRLVIRIPFEFIVADRILPEGTYVLEWLDQTKPNVVMVKNVNNGTVKLLITQRVERWRANSESCLIFTRRGQHLHLTQIWTKGNPNGQQIPSSDERTKRDGSEASIQIKLTLTSKGVPKVSARNR